MALSFVLSHDVKTHAAQATTRLQVVTSHGQPLRPSLKPWDFTYAAITNEMLNYAHLLVLPTFSYFIWSRSSFFFFFLQISFLVLIMGLLVVSVLAGIFFLFWYFVGEFVTGHCWCFMKYQWLVRTFFVYCELCFCIVCSHCGRWNRFRFYQSHFSICSMLITEDIWTATNKEEPSPKLTSLLI